MQHQRNPAIKQTKHESHELLWDPGRHGLPVHHQDSKEITDRPKFYSKLLQIKNYSKQENLVRTKHQVKPSDVPNSTSTKLIEHHCFMCYRECISQTQQSKNNSRTEFSTPINYLWDHSSSSRVKQVPNQSTHSSTCGCRFRSPDLSRVLHIDSSPDYSCHLTRSIHHKPWIQNMQQMAQGIY